MAGNGEILTAITNMQSSLHTKIDTGISRLHTRIDEQTNAVAALTTKVELVEQGMPEVPCDLGIRTLQRVKEIEEAAASEAKEKTKDSKSRKEKLFDAILRIVTAVAVCYVVYKTGWR